MANEMETYVTIKNGDVNVANKLKELFTPKEGEYNSRTIELINRLYGKDYTWDINLSKEENEEAENTWPEYQWLGDNIGSKWIYSEYDHDDDTEFTHLILTTAWSVPQGFLKKLSEVLSDIKEDCYIMGTYEDESYDPMGAFLYGKDFDDIEDLDEEIDEDKIWEDDFYTEDLREKTSKLQYEIEEAYLEFLNEEK
tara:strand:+ start:495 stop:1082 length:588 start_codon:yes stop_codon:yes gene_type:complete